MSIREFNLLEEPWIRVMKSTGEIETKSILDVLFSAQDYMKLAGENEAQNAPVLRLLEAILLTTFYRYDVDGGPSEIEDVSDALDRWESLWNLKHFPKCPIETYIQPYADRFWLIDDENPFMQTKAAERGTEYKTSKLIGDLSESNNKTRIFQSRNLEGKEEIDFQEAARWLLFVNAYDDVSGKKSATLKKYEKETGKKADSPGAGWLGRIAQVYARGENLFQTLMYNLVFLKSSNEIWDEMTPCWEKARRDGERVQVAPPNNPAQLFTLSSRRLLLKIKNKKVIGYYSMGGDFFKSDTIQNGYFVEKNSLYRYVKGTKTKPSAFVLRRHDPARQIWRDFSNLLIKTDSNEVPGVVKWLGLLESENVLNSDAMIYFDTCSVQYGEKDFFITDITGDSLTLHLSMLNNKYKSYQVGVEDVVRVCTELANATGYLARNIAISSGASGDSVLKAESTKGKELFYSLIDPAFRKWISELDLEVNDFEFYKNNFFSVLKELTRKVIRQYEEKISVRSLGGCYFEDKHYSLPESINIYQAQVNKILGGEMKDAKSK